MRKEHIIVWHLCRADSNAVFISTEAQRAAARLHVEHILAGSQ